MTAFHDSFDRPVGPVGNDWLVGGGEMAILVSGYCEFVDGGVWDFLGSGYGAVMRPFGEAASGLWECEVAGHCRGAAFDNWGDMGLVMAANTLDGLGETTAILLNFDVGGYLGLRYYTADGASILQGNTNTNGVEDNAFAYQGYTYPDESPTTEFTYKVVVDPTTGVCSVYVSGVLRGDVTIPAPEMARIKAVYDSGTPLYTGFGVFPYLFGVVKNTFAFTEFTSHSPATSTMAPRDGRVAFYAKGHGS